MKNKIFSLILILLVSISLEAQIDGSLLLGLINMTTTEMNNVSNPVQGSLLYNTTESAIYKYDGSTWDKAGSSSANWNTSGNTGLSGSTNFLGTTNVQDMVLKANNQERLLLSGGNQTVRVNQAVQYGNHPFIIRANGNDVLAFQDNSGTTKWHWNILGGGLNFVETGIADYRLFLQYGGNVGLGTSTPDYKLDVNGTARIENTPTITTATKALVKDPSTGQISEQEITSLSTNGKYVMNFTGRAYFHNNRWYSPSSQYGVAYQHWNHQKGSGNSPTYSTTYQYGVPIPSDVTLARLVMKNDFNGATTNPRINLSIIRNGTIINIGTYNLSSSSTTIFVDNFAVNFSLLANDLLLWSTNSSGANRYNYTSLTFEFTY